MSPSTDERENREFAAELKFRVTPLVAKQVEDWARSRLMADPHAVEATAGAYQITSLYFDTEDFNVFHRKGSFGRCKFRIRRYGRSEMVFLERKLKTRGLLAKRRSAVKVVDLAHLLGEKAAPGWPGYWFHRRLIARRFKAVCQITYRRTARVAMTPFGAIRLTLDENIQALPASAMTFDHATAGTVLNTDFVILELKYRFQMPVVFKLLAEEFALVPEPISKYRLAAPALGLISAPAVKNPVTGLLDSTKCLIF